MQGCILSGARRRPFPHNDWQAADELLEQFRHEYRRVLVVIEGVYSMDGDIPDLPRFVEVKKRHKALLMIDEAHSMGVLGARGRGIGEHFGVSRRRRRHLDGHAQQVVRQLRRLHRRLQGAGRVPEVHGAGVRVQRGHAAAGGGGRAGRAAAAARPSRSGWRGCAQRARLFLDLAKGRGLNTGSSKDSPVVPVILGNSIHCLRAVQGDVRAGGQRAADPPSGRGGERRPAAVLHHVAAHARSRSATRSTRWWRNWRRSMPTIAPMQQWPPPTMPTLKQSFQDQPWRPASGSQSPEGVEIGSKKKAGRLRLHPLHFRIAASKSIMRRASLDPRAAAPAARRRWQIVGLSERVKIAYRATDCQELAEPVQQPCFRFRGRRSGRGIASGIAAGEPVETSPES